MPKRRKLAKTNAHPGQVKDHCSRWTVPREEIFNILVQSQQHLSVKDIYASLGPTDPEVGLTTVYRTLDLLDRAGLIRKINMADGTALFEYKRGDGSDHHHHLICTGCGKILNYRDFEKEELDLVRKTEDALAQKYRFLIREHSIEYIGLCPDCRPGGKNSPIK
jgi:Fur family ferric uptake transcriptional regulator